MTVLRNIIPHAPRTNTPSRLSAFDDLDRVFDNFFRNAISNVSLGNVHMPAASLTDMAVKLNISETDKAYTISADLPGLTQDEVSLTVDDGVLTLSGEKMRETEEDGKTFHRVERSYGRFSRSLHLPEDAAEDGVTAAMKNGVLTIHIAKTAKPEKAQRKIEITG
ncbi:MAG TPA: Hsp20/alpha crystallin family protein [Micavibrio sp.]